MAQAQARATVANMLQQQQMAAAVQQQRAREGQQQALNNAAIAALHRAAAENQNARMQQQQQQQLGGNPAVQQQQQQQQLTMAAAAQIVQSYQQAQQQQAEQMRRAQALKQAHALAQAQQQAAASGAVPTPQSIQAMFKQAQLQEAMAAATNQAQQQRGSSGAIPQGNIYPFSQAQQAQAQAHAHQQAQAQAHIMQAQAAQMQAQARQNMAALANLTPAQLQALGTNPALAHALLQARAAAQAGQQQQQQQAQAVAQQQQQQQQAQAAAQQQANANDPALAAAMRLRQQQMGGVQMGGGQVGGIPIPDNISPVSSNSGSPPTGGGNMSKEQRRMALACVALQLAHSGLSVDQAIHSGIMGGMSVTDVRFIVEVYNAELARMKEAGNMEGPRGGANVEGPRGSMEGGCQPLAAFSLTEPPGLGGPHLRHAPLSGASRHTSSGSPRPSSSYAGSDADNSAPSRSRGGSAVGSAADLMHADPFGEDAAGPPGAPFNAFTYGFFGEPASGGGGDGTGELLGELEGGLGPEDSELAWVPEEESGLPADELEVLSSDAPSKRDDVAERLANLDLGYGFF